MVLAQVHSANGARAHHGERFVAMAGHSLPGGDQGQQRGSRSRAIGTETQPLADAGGKFQLSYLQSKAFSIYSGSSEIQRNIIGERLLGLPR